MHDWLYPRGTGVLDRDDCRIITGMAIDFSNECPEPGKPGGSGEVADQIAGRFLDAQVPTGATGDDGGPTIPEEGDVVGQHGVEELEIREDSPLDRILSQDGQRAELAAWLSKLADADDRAFKASERAEIRREIEALHGEVKTLTELNLDQQKAIDSLLTEVQRGSERMGRKDWVTYAIGAATSIVIMEVVPPLALLPLAIHAIHALSHLLIDA